MMFTAKRAAVLLAATLVLSQVSGTLAEPTQDRHRPQVPSELKQWLYPGASCFASMTDAPMVMAQFTTSAPVRKVATFYRQKVSQGKYAAGAPYMDEVAWSDHTNGGGGINAMAGGSTIKETDKPSISNCLYFVRTNRHVITIQVRYVAAEKQTEITLFGSRR